MPMVAAGAVIAGIASGTTLAAGVLTVGFSTLAFGSSLILGALNYALTPKPKKGSIDQGTQPGTVAVRQSDLTRTIVYGNTRAVRGYAQMISTNSNKDLHVIVILCQGEVRAINEVWLNDYAIPNDWIDGSGNVTQGRYAGYLKIYKHTGADDQLADAAAVLNIPEWTTDHRLQGIAYMYMVFTKNQDVYPTGVPNVSAIVDGQMLYDPRVEGYVWSQNVALMCYDYIKSSYGFAADIDDIDLVNISAQANICDEMVSVNNEDFTATALDPVTNIITVSGDILTLQYGDRVSVSSEGAMPTGLSDSTDYYVIPYQVKTVSRILLATSLENAFARVAVDFSDAGTGVITVTKTAEPRYHGAGVIDTARTLSQNLNDLSTSMAGRSINIAGRWTLLAGAWREPVLELGIGDQRGAGISMKNCLSMSDSYNRVKGLFSGPATSYQDSDYPLATYNTFLSQDLGIEATKELNQPYTTRPTAAQRIAKIELFRGRQDIAFTSDYSTKAMQAQPGDVVNIQIERLGWEPKEFEMTTFALDANENTVITKCGFRETAEEIYDWSAGEAIDYDPAPNTTLTSPYDVQVVGGLGYNSRFIETTGGDSIYMLQLQWDEHPDGFVREWGGFELQFRISDPDNGPDENWSPGFFVDGTITQTDVVAASLGVEYDLRIRARNKLGVRSLWQTIYQAVAGASGGVGTSDDWLLVTGSPTTFNDWGSVTDAPSSFEDWGFVV